MRRLVPTLVVTAALAALTGVLPASACACGGAVPLENTTVAVSSETSLVHLRDGEESITMQLAMLADADEAALVVPTPTPATVTGGSSSTFTELASLTAPDEVVDRQWWPELGRGDGATAGAPGAAPSTPTVLDQVQLGPLEATTLAGGDLDGLTAWLSGHDYDLSPAMSAALEPYVTDGWAFVAMRLTSDDVLAGDLDPVTMTFAADELVYPMRMSAQAADAQHVRVYVVAGSRVERTDPDQGVEQVTYAGWVDGAAVSDPDLAAAVGDRAFLTAFDSVLVNPSEITSDFAYGPTDDVEYRQTTYVTEDVRLLGVMAGPLLLVVGALGLLLVGAVVVVVALRRTPGPDRRRSPVAR